MNKEDYAWYKEHYICTHCRKERAVEGKTLCLACLLENRNYKKKNVDIEERKKRDKQKYEERKTQGMCVNCGKRPQQHGQICNKCYSTILRRKQKTKSNITRSERVSFGICYICGKEKVMKDKGVCPKCYEVRMKSITPIMYLTKEEKNTFWKNL